MEHNRKIDEETAAAESERKPWITPALTIVSMAVADTKGSTGIGGDGGTSPTYTHS